MDRRTIISLVIENNSVYKTIQFMPKIYCGDPSNVCSVYSDLGVEEILIINKDANNKGINFDLLERIIADCFVPMTYCGGVKSFDDFSKLINLGYDRVGFGIEDGRCDYALVKKVIKAFGVQSVAALLSYEEINGKRVTWTNSIPQEINTLINDTELDYFSEIIVQCVNRDGLRSGIDKEVLDVLGIGRHNIILAGGALSFTEVKDIKNSLDVSIAVSSIATLYKNKGVLLQWES